MPVANTDPYPWPYDGDVRPESLALVLAGWDEGWANRSRIVDQLQVRLRSLGEIITSLGGTVITLHHAGAPLLDLYTPHRAVAAFGIDGFHGGPLDDVLRSERRTHLVLAGYGLEAPIHSTMRSANDRGYECLLLTDLSAPLTEDLVAGALSSVTMSGGIFGALGTSVDLLAALPEPTPVPFQEIP